MVVKKTKKRIWIRSVKIEETAHWSGSIERLIIYIGQYFVEVRYFPCLSFVACELYQSREGMRKLGNEEDEQRNFEGHRSKIEWVTTRKKMAMELVQGSWRGW